MLRTRALNCKLKEMQLKFENLLLPVRWTHKFHIQKVKLPTFIPKCRLMRTFRNISSNPPCLARGSRTVHWRLKAVVTMDWRKMGEGWGALVKFCVLGGSICLSNKQFHLLLRIFVAHQTIVTWIKNNCLAKCDNYFITWSTTNWSA